MTGDDDRTTPPERTLQVAEEALRDGFVMVPNSWLDRDDVSPNAKFLYIVLKRFAGAKLQAWPGQSEIMRMTGIGEKPLRAAKAELIRLGVLEQTRRGQGLSNLYLIYEVPAVQNRSIDRFKKLPQDVSRIVSREDLETSPGSQKKIQGRRYTEEDSSPPTPQGGEAPTAVKVNKFAEVIDGIRARGEEYQGNTKRDAAAVKACSASPDEIAEAYVDAVHGKWGNEWLRSNLAIHAVCDRMGAWQASKSRGKNGATIGDDGKLHRIGGKVIDKNGRIYI